MKLNEIATNDANDVSRKEDFGTSSQWEIKNETVESRFQSMKGSLLWSYCSRSGGAHCQLVDAHFIRDIMSSGRRNQHCYDPVSLVTTLVIIERMYVRVFAIDASTLSPIIYYVYKWKLQYPAISSGICHSVYRESHTWKDGTCDDSDSPMNGNNEYTRIMSERVNDLLRLCLDEHTSMSSLCILSSERLDVWLIPDINVLDILNSSKKMASLKPSMLQYDSFHSQLISTVDISSLAIQNGNISGDVHENTVAMKVSVNTCHVLVSIERNTSDDNMSTVSYGRVDLSKRNQTYGNKEENVLMGQPTVRGVRDVSEGDGVSVNQGDIQVDDGIDDLLIAFHHRHLKCQERMRNGSITEGSYPDGMGRFSCPILIKKASTYDVINTFLMERNEQSLDNEVEIKISEDRINLDLLKSNNDKNMLTFLKYYYACVNEDKLIRRYELTHGIDSLINFKMLLITKCHELRLKLATYICRTQQSAKLAASSIDFSSYSAGENIVWQAKNGMSHQNILKLCATETKLLCGSMDEFNDTGDGLNLRLRIFDLLLATCHALACNVSNFSNSQNSDIITASIFNDADIELLLLLHLSTLFNLKHIAESVVTSDRTVPSQAIYVEAFNGSELLWVKYPWSQCPLSLCVAWKFISVGGMVSDDENGLSKRDIISDDVRSKAKVVLGRSATIWLLENQNICNESADANTPFAMLNLNAKKSSSDLSDDGWIQWLLGTDADTSHSLANVLGTQSLAEMYAKFSFKNQMEQLVSMSTATLSDYLLKESFNLEALELRNSDTALEYVHVYNLEFETEDSFGEYLMTLVMAIMDKGKQVLKYAALILSGCFINRELWALRSIVKLLTFCRNGSPTSQSSDRNQILFPRKTISLKSSLILCLFCSLENLNSEYYLRDHIAEHWEVALRLTEILFKMVKDFYHFLMETNNNNNCKNNNNDDSINDESTTESTLKVKKQYLDSCFIVWEQLNMYNKNNNLNIINHIIIFLRLVIENTHNSSAGSHGMSEDDKDDVIASDEYEIKRKIDPEVIMLLSLSTMKYITIISQNNCTTNLETESMMMSSDVMIILEDMEYSKFIEYALQKIHELFVKISGDDDEVFYFMEHKLYIPTVHLLQDIVRVCIRKSRHVQYAYSDTQYTDAYNNDMNTWIESMLLLHIENMSMEMTQKLSLVLQQYSIIVSYFSLVVADTVMMKYVEMNGRYVVKKGTKDYHCRERLIQR